MFSLLIQGLNALDAAHPTKDAVTSIERAIVEFAVDSPEAIKIVGRWFHVHRVRCSNPARTIGPIITTMDPDGIQRNAILVASPKGNARHLLAITCEHIPRLGPDPEIFMFYGGFDPVEIMDNANRQAGFLAFLYPIADAIKLRERLGSVDYIPK